MRFKGKTALITGGGTGIGAAIAERFAADGGAVALMGRRREPLEAVGRKLNAAIIAGDAADPEEMQRAVGITRDRFGGIDVLIANAGGHAGADTLGTDDAAWEANKRMNLDTAFVAARECLPSLIERKGNIVIISSIAGLRGAPQVVGYVTTKHALIGLTKSLAVDYGRQGVRVNAICPGWVKTAMANSDMSVLIQKYGLDSVDEAYAMATMDVPLGRPGEPREVANIVCFLASEEASLMTGTTIVVDGGACAVDLPTIAFSRPA